MTAGLASGRPINHGLRCGNLCLHATCVWAYAIGKTFTPVRGRPDRAVCRPGAACIRIRGDVTRAHAHAHHVLALVRVCVGVCVWGGCGVCVGWVGGVCGGGGGVVGVWGGVCGGGGGGWGGGGEW